MADPCETTNCTTIVYIGTDDVSSDFVQRLDDLEAERDRLKKEVEALRTALCES